MANFSRKYLFHQVFENKKLNKESMAPYSSLFYLVFLHGAKNFQNEWCVKTFFNYFEIVKNRGSIT
jgi:hypothetical protein